VSTWVKAQNEKELGRAEKLIEKELPRGKCKRRQRGRGTRGLSGGGED